MLVHIVAKINGRSHLMMGQLTDYLLFSQSAKTSGNLKPLGKCGTKCFMIGIDMVVC